MELAGLANYGLFFLTFAGIYGILALGLNVQWGLAGQFNIGIAGFFAIGAYASAIMTTQPTPSHLGGFGWPILAGLVVAVVCSGLVAVVIGAITVRLRTDYLAIATIGIAETIRLVLKNEEWLTNGVRGIPGIPRSLEGGLGHGSLAMLAAVLIGLALVYWLLERARVSPWGRVMRAIRENEAAAAAAGKNITRFRLEAFVLGSMTMGLAGGLYAHFFGFIGPEAFTPEFGTFLIWVMLIAGGSGNNRGAIAGAFGIWLIWTGSEMLTSLLPVQYVTQAGAIRLLLIGVLIQLVLILRPHGMIPDPDQSSR